MKKRYIKVKQTDNSDIICNEYNCKQKTNFIINVLFDDKKISYYLCKSHFKKFEEEILEGKNCYDRKRNSN